MCLLPFFLRSNRISWRSVGCALAVKFPDYQFTQTMRFSPRSKMEVSKNRSVSKFSPQRHEDAKERND
jgi:hypothetical protein